MKLWFDVRCDERSSIFSREHNVVEEVGVRVRHVATSTTLLNIGIRFATPTLCHPLRGLCGYFFLRVLGFRCAPPQALRCHPLPGLEGGSTTTRVLAKRSITRFVTSSGESSGFIS